MADKKNKFVTLDDKDKQKEIPLPKIYEGTCIQCKWFDVSLEWFGPRCANKASPRGGQRTPESGTCTYGEYKPVSPAAQDSTGDNEEGLYNPDATSDTVPHGKDIFAEEEED